MRDPKAETTYRPAVPADAPVLLTVVQAGFETYRDFAPAGWMPPDETRPEMVERYTDELAQPSTFALVAEVGGEVAGHVTLVRAVGASTDGTTPDQHLRHLFVLPPYWGTGIARALHAAMLEHVRGTVRLYTPAAQARARRFYEREGWTLYQGPHFFHAIGFDLVEYRLRRGEPVFPSDGPDG